MFDPITNLGAKPAHPLQSVAAAKQLLSGLSADPATALEQIASWLGSLAATAGYRAAERVAIVGLLDETARPLESRLVRAILASRELWEFERLRMWQVALEFWERLVEAYALCRSEGTLQDSKICADDLPRMITRELRAITDQMRLLHLRHLPVPAKIWATLFGVYQLAESLGCEVRRMQVFAADAIQVAPRHEFLRALILDAASPESMLPPQVELAARVARRFAESFLFRDTPEEDCNWAIDLARPHRPLRVNPGAGAGASARYFGAGVVIAKMESMVERLTAHPEVKEQRFGDDFSPQEKLIVLKHLIRYWGVQLPAGPA